MPTYRLQRFWNELHLDGGEEVSAAELSTNPNGQSVALVKEAEDDGEESDEEPICGAVLDSGSPCQRSVSDSGDTCWQH